MRSIVGRSREALTQRRRLIASIAVGMLWTSDERPLASSRVTFFDHSTTGLLLSYELFRAAASIGANVWNPVKNSEYWRG